jgi:hypothetical protein
MRSASRHINRVVYQSRPPALEHLSPNGGNDSRIALAIPNNRSASDPIAPRHMLHEPLTHALGFGELVVVEHRSLEGEEHALKGFGV